MKPVTKLTNLNMKSILVLLGCHFDWTSLKDMNFDFCKTKTNLLLINFKETSTLTETKKQKVTDGHLSSAVGLALVNADDDMGASQTLFGVFQKANESLLGTAVGHLRRADVDVKSTVPQNRIPSVVVGLVDVRGRHHTWETALETESQALQG